MTGKTLDNEPTNIFNGVIRPARRDELAKIMTLERRGFPIDQWAPEDMKPYLDKSLKGKKTFLFLAFNTAAAAEQRDAPAAGYVLGELTGRKTGELVSLTVDPSSRGQKLGQKLLDRICDSLRNAGAEKIVLEVRKENPAVHLYEKNGFVKTGELPSGWYPPDEIVGASGAGIEMTRYYATGTPVPGTT